MKSPTSLWFLAGLIVGVCAISAAYAAPGDAQDPLVSLSYLKSGAAFRQVNLGAGEKLVMAPGEEFILVDGEIHLEGNASFTTVDISRGKAIKDPKLVERNHLVIFMGNSSVNVIADKNAVCLVRGTALD